MTDTKKIVVHITKDKDVHLEERLKVGEFFKKCRGVMYYWDDKKK